MHVQVIYLHTGIPIAVDDQTVTILSDPFAARDLRGDDEHVADQLLVVGRHIIRSWNGLVRNDENMRRCSWVNVAESHDPVILVDEFSWQFATDDALEKSRHDCEARGTGMRVSLRYRHDEAQQCRGVRVKLSLDSLGSHLSQTLLPIYLISGDEPLLVSEAGDAIRARARSNGFTERQVFFIERAASVWQDINQESQALSLFATNRIVEIRMPGGKPGIAGAAALLRLFQAAGPDLLVLIVTGALERDTQGAEWVNAAQQRGAYLPIRSVDRATLPRWLQSRFAANGLKPTEEALALLAERSEGNLLAARQEIDKLALLLPAGAAVSASDVEAGSADSARFDVFQLTEAIRSGDAARALRVLGGLAAEGTEPPLLLWALVRELRGMQARAASAPRLPFARLTARAARADRMAKGLSAGDAWDELALLAVEMTGRRTLPLLRAPQ